MAAWKNVFCRDYKLSMCSVQLTFIAACPSKGKESTTLVVQKFVTGVAVSLAHFPLFCVELEKNACSMVFLIKLYYNS
jgi:hypothetical protein